MNNYNRGNDAISLPFFIQKPGTSTQEEVVG